MRAPSEAEGCPMHGLLFALPPSLLFWAALAVVVGVNEKQKQISDAYLEAVEELQDAKDRLRRATSEECSARNAVTRAEKLVKATQEVFCREFGLTP